MEQYFQNFCMQNKILLLECVTIKKGLVIMKKQWLSWGLIFFEIISLNFSSKQHAQE